MQLHILNRRVVLIVISQKLTLLNDSPKEEIITRLIDTGLNREEAELVLACYYLERIEKQINASRYHS